MKAYYPGLHLARPKVDLCDRCIRIETELCNPDITEERKEFLEKEKLVHLEEAKSQRRIWSNFVRDYVGKVDPNLVIPDNALPCSLDLDEPSQVMREQGGVSQPPMLSVQAELPHSEEKLPDKQAAEPLRCDMVQVQAEDYGGGIALPHYGFRRPSADYFNSNLMTYNFVIADITTGVNNVFYYDERHQGKGADALCSLRIRYHLRKYQSYSERKNTPKLCMILLDNCVGQNKSQVVMKFMSLLSILFYETVALMFFLPGHTHMVADRVVANCKNAIKNLNLYTLGQIAEKCEGVEGINAE